MHTPVLRSMFNSVVSTAHHCVSIRSCHRRGYLSLVRTKTTAKRSSCSLQNRAPFRRPVHAIYSLIVQLSM